jgi:hypothetical protein
MRVAGNVNFLLNNVIGFVLEPYDGLSDPAKPFPEDPKVGRVIYRTDEQQVYVCVATNPIVWLPLIKVAESYVHIQDTVATTWTITHNLETTNVLVQVYDNAGNKFIPDAITVVDNNTVQVDVNPSTAGKALIIALDASVGAFVQHNQLSLDVLKSGQEISNVTYNSDNKPTLVNYSDGTYVEITYVPTGSIGDGEVDTMTFKNSSGAIIEQWKFTYDSNNRLISTQKLA